jgi:hypothetical protein
LAEKIWYCVMRVETYRIAYLGQSAAEAVKATDETTYCASAAVMGDAERLAAIGTGKLTQRLRAAQRHLR